MDVSHSRDIGRLVAVLTALTVAAGASAQTITVRYANDYFAATDYYYTQGIHVEVDFARWGLFVGQEGFTPTDLSDPDVRPRDRPYAGTFYLGTRGELWRDGGGLPPWLQHGTWRYEALLGLIGPAALAEEQQTGIHRAIEDEIPRGWRHQIRNGLLLDAELGFRQNLFSRPHLATDGLLTARLGTFRTRLTAESEVRAGWRWGVGFARLQTWVPLRDASLQGNLIGASSIHTFRYGQLRPVVGRIGLGFRVRLNRFLLAYERTWQSREFDGARRHGWGALSIRVNARALGRRSLLLPFALPYAAP